jgi:phosphoribosylformylglycinamidine synthase subunit PurQ / glutaminase
MMPHPERAADAQHGGTDGKAMFSGLVEALS